MWIEKSLQKLAILIPARYDKPEETSDIVSSLDTYIYEMDIPVQPALPESESDEPVRVEEAGSVAESEPEKSSRVEESGPVEEFEPGKSAQHEQPESIKDSEPEKSERVEESGSVSEFETVEPAQDGKREPPL